MTTIQPARKIEGRLELPGDKSISHRAALVAALATGETVITNFATSADCHSTLNCLRDLGVKTEVEETNVRVRGTSDGVRPAFAKSIHALDCGNSGTTMRLLCGLLAWQNFETTLTGDRSLSARPMTRVITPLAQMGAGIQATDGHAPLVIAGRETLDAITYELPVASAQVKSAVLLAGLGARGGRTVVVERIAPTRDHTERMLRWFGAHVEVEAQSLDDMHDEAHDEMHDGATTFNRISVEGNQKLTARACRIPGDVSSAAFLIAAAVMLDGSHLSITNVGLNPTRTQFIRTLETFGANIEISNAREECGEPVGDLIVRGRGRLSTKTNNVVRGRQIANLIDELPMLAVVGALTEGGLTVRDAEELRVKETDRIRAVVENLRRMNADIEEHADGFTVAGNSSLRGARLDSFGDHRIAMAFSVAALAAKGETYIDDAEAIAVSFPNFYEQLASVTIR